MCVKVHIRNDILICRTFLYVAIFGPGGPELTSFYCNFTSSVLLIRNLLNGCPVFFSSSSPPPPLPSCSSSSYSSFSSCYCPNTLCTVSIFSFLNTMKKCAWNQCWSQDDVVVLCIILCLIYWFCLLRMYALSLFSRLAICFQRNSSDFFISSTLCFPRTTTASSIIFKAAL